MGYTTRTLYDEFKTVTENVGNTINDFSTSISDVENYQKISTQLHANHIKKFDKILSEGFINEPVIRPTIAFSNLKKIEKFLEQEDLIVFDIENLDLTDFHIEKESGSGSES